MKEKFNLDTLIQDVSGISGRLRIGVWTRRKVGLKI